MLVGYREPVKLPEAPNLILGRLDDSKVDLADRHTALDGIVDEPRGLIAFASEQAVEITCGETPRRHEGRRLTSQPIARAHPIVVVVVAVVVLMGRVHSAPSTPLRPLASLRA